MNAPEGKSSLQSRLNEAERRAQDAELSAQDAQAALARTLLEAAHVEAVVTARVKAQSEAELSALRNQLDAVKLAPSQRVSAVGGRDGGSVGAASGRPEVAAEAPIGSTAGEGAAPDKGAAAHASENRLADASNSAAADTHSAPPEMPDAALIDAANSQMLRFLPPIRLAFLSVTAIVAIVSYLVASSIMHDRDGKQSIAMNAVSEIAGFAAGDDRLVQGAATDSTAIAAASATLDAELERLRTLSQKVAAMRALVAQRTVSNAPASGAADRKVSADRMVAAPDASWLLYMPVEHDALVQYLAGKTWPGIQVAAQEKAAAPRKN